MKKLLLISIAIISLYSCDNITKTEEPSVILHEKFISACLEVAKDSLDARGIKYVDVSAKYCSGIDTTEKYMYIKKYMSKPDIKIKEPTVYAYFENELNGNSEAVLRSYNIISVYVQLKEYEYGWNPKTGKYEDVIIYDFHTIEVDTQNNNVIFRY